MLQEGVKTFSDLFEATNENINRRKTFLNGCRIHKSGRNHYQGADGNCKLVIMAVFTKKKTKKKQGYRDLLCMYSTYVCSNVQQCHTMRILGIWSKK